MIANKKKKTVRLDSIPFPFGLLEHSEEEVVQTGEARVTDGYVAILDELFRKFHRGHHRPCNPVNRE
jgi:hypothetical protein